jgi:long-chain fatty acid transport protein
MNFQRWTGAGIIFLAAMTPFMAQANGIDRPTAPNSFLFEEGTYLEMTAAFGSPSVSGVGPLGPSSNVLKSFAVGSLSFKTDLSERLSFGFRYSVPYASKSQYPAVYGGVQADLRAEAIDLLLKYDLSESFGVFGGPRFLRWSGSSGGLAPTPGGPVPVSFGFDGDYEVSAVLGARYENQNTYTRVLLEYYSPTSSTVKTTLNGGPSPANYVYRSPETIKLNVVQPLSRKTSVFGLYSFSNWSDANITNHLGASGPGFSDVHNYTLGVGHKVTDKLALSVAGIYRTGNSSPTAINLPVTDRKGLAVGVRYQVNDKMHIGATVSHFWLGDTLAGPVSYTGSTSLGAALNVGYRF